VLRIDGSVQAWGKNLVDSASFRRKNGVATADIFVPTSEWSGRDAVHIRRVLAAGVVDAIEALAALAERRQIDIAIRSLRRDVSAAAEEFLA
jgi:hypothetical protein